MCKLGSELKLNPLRETRTKPFVLLLLLLHLLLIVSSPHLLAIRIARNRGSFFFPSRLRFSRRPYLSTFSHLHQPYRESSLLFNVVTSFTAIEPILRGFPESTRRSVHARRRFDHVSRYPRKRPRGIYVRGTRSPFVEGGREREGGREEKRKRESE